MTGQLRYDPEYLAILEAAYGQAPVPTPPPSDIHEFRAMCEDLMRNVLRREPTPENITRRDILIKSHDGKTIQVRGYTVSGAVTDVPGPAVLYIHGGGMVSCDIEIYDPVVARHAARTGIPFFAVEYRLAPEQTGDGLVKDAYAALEYLSSHAAELGIDPARIAVMGDSAGGGIAAGTALMARDKNLHPPIAKQMLFYPMLDDRNPELGLENPQSKFHFIWGSRHSEIAYEALLGEDKAGKEEADVSVYAVPARATDLSNLPDTYLDVGGLDLFVSEAIAYAGSLAKANVQTEFHLWPGQVHGFDATPTSTTKAAYEARDKFLRTL